MLSGTVAAAQPGARGFDANTPLSDAQAQAFVQAGYTFCLRYVGRTEMKSTDLSAAEAQRILNAGLALMTVQHVLNPGWNPTQALGQEYGANAAAFTKQIGLPPGVSVWLDLECVADGTAASDVVAYCNAWYDQVAAAGYLPGLYVGYAPGLSGQQLYGKLKFKNYWAAYNVDGVSNPSPRGWQMVQSEGHGTIGGITTQAYDADVIQQDGKGGVPMWLKV
ncbi:MAG TPA: DUF1906 domain-containing protein [Longimicrobium sp.]|jgi:hypothetical protein|uniref:DUF1906 domain-containing protein n=1 Tax=Longimicrobium sp. TaxID=2029185 RepID=UPI002EDAC89B